MISKATRLIFLFSAIFFGGILLANFFYPIFGVDFNAFFAYRALRADPTGSVVIVSIDNRSLDALTQSDLKVLTFSKKTYIELIEKLQTAWARAIGLDIVLANPDPDAARLVEIMDRYKNITIAAKVGNGSKDWEVVLPQSIYPQKYWSMIDVIARKNIVSEITPLSTLQWNPIEAFALRLYRLATGDTTSSKGVFTTKKYWFLPQKYYSMSPIREIPLTDQGTLLIPFLRHRGEFPKIALIDVLTGKFPSDFFRNKIVLVGEYGTLIHDVQIAPTDLTTKMPGVEFHANMLESLLKNSPLRSIAPIPEFWLLFVFALIGIALTLYTRLWQCLLWIVTSPILLFFVTLYAHAAYGILIDVWYIFFAGIISPVLGGWIYRYVALDAQRRFLTGAFSHYISPVVVAKIAENPESFTLWGERRDLTVFFSDIAGFTNISEKLGTEKLFALITEYLSEMTEILVQNNGTLDKYIGDAVMGFYWAPLPLDRSSYWACKTALEQQSRLRDLNIKWQQQDIPYIRMRIGIHRGEAMVGNIGSRDRFNYTAMGDSVNLTSRLEGVNKEYDTMICVSQSIAEEVESEFFLRKLDRIQVKGKDQGVDIFELVAFAHDTSPEVAQKKLWAESYARALELYFKGDFASAREIFRLYLADGPASIMAARCISLIAGTTELKNWVFVFNHK